MRVRVLVIVLACCSTACGLEGRPGLSPPPHTAAATDVPATTAPASEPPSTSAAATAPPPSATPAAPPGCRNSTSPSCGPFRFDPEPEDQALDLDVTVTPRSPRAGDTVTFTLSARDPDAPTISFGTYEFSQEGPAVVKRGESQSCPTGYGPWDRPKTSAGGTQRTLRHTYRQAGRFEATFTALSRSGGDLPGDGDGHCIDPYGGSAKTDVVVVVR